MNQFDTITQTIGIPYYSNLKQYTMGMDSPEHCFDKQHYKSYPAVTYLFNELGFRFDLDLLVDCPILAIGDSFTVGLGVNAADTWPAKLAQSLGVPVLNFSLNGASNDWMSRKTLALLPFFNPRALIVHYTFSHRRERPIAGWHDDERTECNAYHTARENFKNWQANYKIISNLGVPVVHSFIPNWHTEKVDYSALSGTVVPPIAIVDLARDGFHYGVKTHQQVATNLLAGGLRQFL